MGGSQQSPEHDLSSGGSPSWAWEVLNFHHPWGFSWVETLVGKTTDRWPLHQLAAQLFAPRKCDAAHQLLGRAWSNGSWLRWTCGAASRTRTESVGNFVKERPFEGTNIFCTFQWIISSFFRIDSHGYAPVGKASTTRGRAHHLPFVDLPMLVVGGWLCPYSHRVWLLVRSIPLFLISLLLAISHCRSCISFSRQHDRYMYFDITTLKWLIK